jgi:hypothetical protein
MAGATHVTKHFVPGNLLRNLKKPTKNLHSFRLGNGTVLLVIFTRCKIYRLRVGLFAYISVVKADCREEV